MPDIPRFDGVAHWATLSPEQQSQIGALALELIVANDTAYAVCDVAGNVNADPVKFRAASAAGEYLIGGLRDATDTVLPDWHASQRPVPSSIGEICGHCGGSYGDPCDCRIARAS